MTAQCPLYGRSVPALCPLYGRSMPALCPPCVRSISAPRLRARLQARLRLVRELGLAQRAGYSDEQVVWLYRKRYRMDNN